jgi:hypothetical protein
MKGKACICHPDTRGNNLGQIGEASEMKQQATEIPTFSLLLLQVKFLGSLSMSINSIEHRLITKIITRMD